jgi:hypothetical protein
MICSKKLFEVLSEKPNGSRLIFELQNIKDSAAPLLVKISETFPEYTIHDIRHSDTLLNILDWLIPDSLKYAMNEYELYFLIASVYLHDIGMVNFPELFDKSDFMAFAKKHRKRSLSKRELVADYIRENHHIRSEMFINKRWKDLKIENFSKAQIIGRICRGHRDNLHNRNLYDNRQMYSAYSKPINVSFLALLLQVADELDLTYERTPMLIYETIKPRNPISTAEWDKNLSVMGVGLDPSNPLRILVSAHCKNPDIHRALKRSEVKIQSKLDQLPEPLYQYSEFAKQLPQRIYFQIESEGYMVWDLKFSLQEKEIVALLMGEKIYNRKEDAIRELLQNSIDACRTRRALLKNQGKDFTPEIQVSMNPKRDRIVVSDNGTGMDPFIIENFFTRIGRSFYKSPEFIEQGLEFTPISEFGIGIISCFMIARKIVVETKAENCKPYTIEIESVDDYFIIHEGKREDVGTTVTLFLKDEIKNQKFDLYDVVRYYARHIEFPIKVSCNGQTRIVQDEWMDMKPEILREKGFTFTYDIALYTIDVNEKDLRGKIGIAFNKFNGSYLPLREWVFRIPEYGPQKRFTVLVSKNGIFVNDVPELLPEWFPNLILADLNLYGEILDLQIGRTKPIQKSKFYRLRDRIIEIILNGLYDLFKQERSKNFLLFMENCYDYFYYHLPRLHEHPDLVDRFIQEFAKVRCFTKSGIEYLGKEEMLKEKRPIIVIYEAPNTPVARYFINKCSGFIKGELYIIDKFAIDLLYFLNVEPTKVENWLSRFKFDLIRDEGKIFPKTWKIAKFLNYHSVKMIETFGTSKIFVNADHPFIDKLLHATSKNMLNEERRKAILLFFRDIKRARCRDILNDQKRILNWLKELGIIDDINLYLLGEKDLATI